MSRRCQHNHHRPRVEANHRNPRRPWVAFCSCGWRQERMFWRNALAQALMHSQELTS